MGNRYIISSKHHDNFMLRQQHVDKIALVTEGGGQRGIFTAGVLDAFLHADFNPFDLLMVLLLALSTSPRISVGIKGMPTKSSQKQHDALSSLSSRNTCSMVKGLT
ncbi:hypothetical protein THF1D04_10359 [Vibrio owensii]|uniref:PNPLA domain-containing protein n=1 Tax=Vibrio owensii TaxID=696485 RepID=A0AAU9PYG9_9VIBR|nr:hypothetical protein THF1D04_10359 [Vibrio owensii]